MNDELNPEVLRNAARRIQGTAIPALDSVSDVGFPLVEGDLRRFPRESTEAQAAIEGLSRLRESLDQVVAELYAAAEALEVARERDIELPKEIFVPVLPYVIPRDRRTSEEHEAQSD